MLLLHLAFSDFRSFISLPIELKLNFSVIVLNAYHCIIQNYAGAVCLDQVINQVLKAPAWLFQ